MRTGVCFRHHRHTAAAAAAAIAEAAHTVTRRAETLSECTNVAVRTGSRFPVLRLSGAACLQASPPASCIRNKVEPTRAPELHESGFRNLYIWISRSSDGDWSTGRPAIGGRCLAMPNVGWWTLTEGAVWQIVSFLLL